VELFDLDSHLRPEFSIKVGERLVKKEKVDLFDKAAADRHPLTLASRQLRWLPVKKMIDLKEICRPHNASMDLGGGELSSAQTKLQIAADRLGRVQRVGLKNHGKAAVFRVEVGDLLPTDVDLTIVKVEQPSEDVEEGGLATSGRAKQNDEFAVLDFEIEVF